MRVGLEEGALQELLLRTEVLILEKQRTIQLFLQRVVPRYFGRNRAFASDAAEALRVDANELLKLGIVDQVLTEPTGWGTS